MSVRREASSAPARSSICSARCRTRPGVKRQVIGVFSAVWLEPMAEVLRNLGSERVWITHGSDGLDEITTTGPTKVVELKDGAIHAFEVTPEDAGLPRAAPEALRGGEPHENAKALAKVLDGNLSAYRDIALLNAAAALVVAGKAASLKEGVASGMQQSAPGPPGAHLTG